MRSPYQSVGLSRHYVSALNNFGSYQIDQFDKSLHIHHEILRFQIADDNPLRRQILQNQYH